MSNTLHSEKELIQGLKTGDKSSFEICFRSYYAALYSYAFTLLKQTDAAQEIVQETFIKIWENRDQIIIYSSLKSYLFRCVHNNCINYSKKSLVIAKQTDRLVQEIKYHTELATLNFTEEILDLIISHETEEFLNKAIQELPEQCKQIFILSRFDQLTYEQIAQKLNISVNTVKTQLRRAFDKLKDALKKIEEK